MAGWHQILELRAFEFIDHVDDAKFWLWICPETDLEKRKLLDPLHPWTIIRYYVLTINNGSSSLIAA